MCDADGVTWATACEAQCGGATLDCSLEQASVCGTDGKMYLNDCHRALL